MELPGEKLVIKLWETLVERGMGSLLSPWQAGREGRVRNEIRRAEMLMLAQAEVDVADIRSGKKQLQSDGSLLLKNGLNEISPINERVEPFFALSLAVESGKKTEFSAAARSEINSSKAIIFAEEQLAADGHIPSEKGIEEDWLFIWREHAGRVSSVDLQRLWGSVLAGELKDPGKHSIRTLEFLKTLSKADAELISSLARYVVDNRIQRVSGITWLLRGFHLQLFWRLRT
ncbi:DUF2806 domain-containing protein [Delftia sp. GW456-R20]|uniref:DUF2806 domain-containing protein n=1 Tax=Delftia sp. GW456-R20 TaxID=1827145 RepID=UPI000B2A82A3|nr:DUF2806 domain-containing protein [Delftia sp. GW456-R20]